MPNNRGNPQPATKPRLCTGVLHREQNSLNLNNIRNWRSLEDSWKDAFQAKGQDCSITLIKIFSEDRIALIDLLVQTNICGNLSTKAQDNGLGVLDLNMVDALAATLKGL